MPLNIGKPKSDEGPVKGPITPIFKVLAAEVLAVGVAGGATAATIVPCWANEHTLAKEATKKTKLLLAGFENGEKIEDIRDFGCFQGA